MSEAEIVELCLAAHYRIMKRPRFWYEPQWQEASKRLCVMASDMRKKLRENSAVQEEKDMPYGFRNLGLDLAKISQAVRASEPHRYTKKPVTIEAILWDGENRTAVESFCPTVIFDSAKDSPDAKPNPGVLVIPTLEGPHMAEVGDYIICGVKGEFYPCKPDIFDMTYEPARDVITE